MTRISLTCTSGLLTALLLFPAALPGQTPSPKPAKVCDLLPMAELEAHFGVKPNPPRGHDATTVSMCAVDIPDRQHGANVMTNVGSPQLSVEQRLVAMHKALEAEGAQTKNFGSIGCFTGKLDMGATKLPTTTCFLDKDGYISLSLWSDNENQLSFDAVKALLEKAAARRQ